MHMPLPSCSADWLGEVLDHLEVAALAAAGEGLEDEPDQQRWLSFMQRQAVSSCRLTRGLSTLDASEEDELAPEREVDELDEIDDIAHALRNDLPGELREVVSEAQLFLLFYLAAHIRAGVIDRSEGQAVALACWQECRGEDCDDEPLSVQAEVPANASAWLDEIIAAFSVSSGATELELSDGAHFTAFGDSLLQTAILLALDNRRAAPSRAELEELIDTITAMEADVSGSGPEWQAMRRIPSLSFAMYYVWVHLALGLTDEKTAMAVMGECTSRISEFPDPLPRER
jgi:hypothetical protein